MRFGTYQERLEKKSRQADVHSDVSAVMAVAVLILLRYFRRFIRNADFSVVWLTVFVIYSLVFFGLVSAGGVYCARGM